MVNAIHWPPGQANFFASCSDDHTIRVWGNEALEGNVTIDSKPQARTNEMDARNGNRSQFMDDEDEEDEFREEEQEEDEEEDDDEGDNSEESGGA